MSIVEVIPNNKIRVWASSLIHDVIDCWAADSLHEALPELTDGEVWDIDDLSQEDYELLLDRVGKEIRNAHVEVFWDDY